MTPLHPQAAALLRAIQRAGGKPLAECEPSEARERTRRLIEIVAPGPEMASVTDEVLPAGQGIPVRIYRPAGVLLPLRLVYLHGGGWVVGGLDGGDSIARALAHSSRCELASVDYRLAPEHRFPAAVDDAWAAVTALAARGWDRLVVVGDSAGGNLAAACARRARDAGAPDIALQVLFYPVCDHDFSRDSYRRDATGWSVGPRELEWFWQQYVPDAGLRDAPDASPLRAADLSGVAGAYIVAAAHDPLHDEVVAYGRRLAESGVPVRLRRHEDMMHGFVAFQGVLDAATVAIDEAGQAIRDRAAEIAGAAPPLSAGHRAV